MKGKIYFIVGVWCVSSYGAVAEVPDVAYAHDYLRDVCHNPNLNFGDANPKSLVSNKYFIGLIDELNKNNVDYFTKEPTPTSYALDATNDNIISVEVLDDNLAKLTDSAGCCRGGRVNPETGKCHACIPFTVGENATCPTNFKQIKFDNLTIAESAAACPAGSEVYYQPPCDDTIIFDDTGDTTNIGVCVDAIGVAAYSGQAFTNPGTGYGNRGYMADGWNCTYNKVPLSCQRYARRVETHCSAAPYAGADNFEEYGGLCYCKLTHIYGPNGQVTPVEAKWVLHTWSNYGTSCGNSNCAYWCFHVYDTDWRTDMIMGVIQND